MESFDARSWNRAREGKKEINNFKTWKDRGKRNTEI